MKHLIVVIIIISLSACGLKLQAQNLSESETVQYIQNTFNNYTIDINKTRDITRKIQIIKYNNPIMIIEFKERVYGSEKNIRISFNVNDVVFEIKRSSYIGWEQLIIKGNANISFEDKLTSSFDLHVQEKDKIVLTRLINAITHLQNISGKGSSKPDPFDNPVQVESQRNISSNNSSTAIAQRSTPINNSSTTQQTLITYTNQSKRFSIDYPRGWNVNENAQGVVFLAPENGLNFRTNFNVITSNRTETLDKLVQMSQQQIANSNAFVGYRLETKENRYINGMNGIKIIASYKLGGYAVKGIQYTLKKADNTVYTISFTVGEQSYQRDKNLIEDIIKSFKSL